MFSFGKFFFIYLMKRGSYGRNKASIKDLNCFEWKKVKDIKTHVSRRAVNFFYSSFLHVLEGFM